MGKHKRTIYTICAVLISFLFIPKVNAWEPSSYNVTYSGTTLTTNSWPLFDLGNHQMRLYGSLAADIEDYSPFECVDFYVKISLCSDAKFTGYSIVSGATNLSVYNTSLRCDYVGSDYTGGRIIEIMYKTWQCDGTSTFDSYIDVYQNKLNALSLISVQFGTSPFTQSDDTGARQNDEIIGQNSTIIGQNQTLMEQNNNLYNKQNEINTGINATYSAVNETNNKLKETNDTLNNNDSTEATNEAGSFFSGFTTDTFGLTSIITAPLNLITSITSSTCTSAGVPLPYLTDKKLELPCLRGIYEQHFGSILTIYQTITFGFIAYWVCIRIFALVKDFKNPEHDEIEVLDL